VFGPAGYRPRFNFALIGTYDVDLPGGVYFWDPVNVTRPLDSASANAGFGTKDQPAVTY